MSATENSVVITSNKKLFLSQHLSRVVLILDTNFNIIDANNTACAYFETTPESLNQKNVWTLFSNYPNPLECDNDLQALIKRYPIIAQYHLLNDYRGIIWHLTANPENNKQFFFIAEPFENKNSELISKEIIEAKEKAENANRAKLDFLANMSHELRNSLNGILGMAQILTVRSLPSDTQDYIKDIYKSGTHLLKLVADMLDFTKLGAGQLTFTNEPFNLRKLMTEIIQTQIKQCEKHNLDLILDYSEDVPRFVKGDAHRLRQIVLNLMTNAIKFTPKGHILVAVDIVHQNEEQGLFQITVEDTGIGIPKDKLESIFERYVQIKDKPHHNRDRGTGLGLAIVKQLIEKMGGEIGINSTPNKGSTFWIKLPFDLQIIDDEEPDWLKKYLTTRVLVVDDNKKRGDTILKQFMGKEHNIARGEHALTALHQAAKENNPYKIILVDDQIKPGADPLAKSILEDESIPNALLCILSRHKNHGNYSAYYFYEILKPTKPNLFTKDLLNAWKRWHADNTSKQKSKSKRNIKPNVLLVEDNPLSQKVACIMFEELGCDVTLAKNATQAMSLLEHHYDVIFLDIGLPDMDGCDLAEKIIQDSYSNQNTPMLALTAHAMESDKERFIASGMKDVLTKPITYDSAEKALVKWTHLGKS